LKQTYNVVDGKFFIISQLIKDKRTSRTLSKFIECADIFTLQNWLTVCVRQLLNRKYRVTLLSKCLRNVVINHHLYKIVQTLEKDRILFHFYFILYTISTKQRHNTGRYIGTRNQQQWNPSIAAFIEELK